MNAYPISTKVYILSEDGFPVHTFDEDGERIEAKMKEVSFGEALENAKSGKPIYSFVEWELEYPHSKADWIDDRVDLEAELTGNVKIRQFAEVAIVATPKMHLF